MDNICSCIGSGATHHAWKSKVSLAQRLEGWSQKHHQPSLGLGRLVVCEPCNSRIDHRSASGRLCNHTTHVRSLVQNTSSSCKRGRFPIYVTLVGIVGSGNHIYRCTGSVRGFSYNITNRLADEHCENVINPATNEHHLDQGLACTVHGRGRRCVAVLGKLRCLWVQW